MNNIPGDQGIIIKTKVTQLYKKSKAYQMLGKIKLVRSGNNKEQLPENVTSSLVANVTTEISWRGKVIQFVQKYFDG